MGEVNDDDLMKKVVEDYFEQRVILEDLGKEALKKALTDHFTAELQNDPNGGQVSIPDLVKYHLSRSNLKSTFQSLYSNDLIQVRKVQPGDNHEVSTQFPILVMVDFAIVVGVSSLKNVNADLWEMTLPKRKRKSKVGPPCTLQILEKHIGFVVGMHKFALQVAGLMYVASLRDDAMFWKNYKQYMRVLPAGQFEALKAESAAFEKKMAFVVEAIPCFMGFVCNKVD